MRTRLALVALAAPVLLTLAFILFVAAPMYQAETRFSIRGADAGQGGVGGMGGMAGAGNPGMALAGFVDGYAVRDFLQSRDAMGQLDARIGLADFLSRRTIDPFAWLPSNPTSDALFDKFQSVVTARYNMVEQIVVVDTLGFSSEDAVRLAKALLSVADEFVNNLNRRSLEDQVKVAQDGVTRAENRSATARAALAKWRAENSNIDPAGDVTMLNQLLTQLEGQLATAENDLAQLRSLSPSNPRRGSAELAVQSVRDQIAETRKRFGGGSTNAAKQIFAYEALNAEGSFAEQSLANARQNLSNAQQVLQRQQRYVTVVSQPVAQMRPAYPDKMKLLALSLLSGVVLAFFVIFGLGIAR